MVVRKCHNLDEMSACVALQEEVWNFAEAECSAAGACLWWRKRLVARSLAHSTMGNWWPSHCPCRVRAAGTPIFIRRCWRCGASIATPGGTADQIVSTGRSPCHEDGRRPRRCKLRLDGVASRLRPSHGRNQRKPSGFRGVHSDARGEVHYISRDADPKPGPFGREFASGQHLAPCARHPAERGQGNARVDGWQPTAPRHPPFTAPAVRPATIWRCANTVSSSTGNVTIRAAAASGPQLSWSNEIML